ncbi:MAG: LacI family DNA-binding transcriptional regulator [Eubacteriales bacterium]|nr:LacI family DNA-binding transcriptional regulator [Eubacteriales bacterium]
MGVTVQQIADATGVSRGTVDRALNNRGRVDPDVAEKIRKAAVELGYVKKPRKAGGKKKTCRIGVVTHLAGASFMISINRGIREAAEELADRGIEILLRESMSVDEKEQVEMIRSLKKEGIDGLALMAIDCEGVRDVVNELIEEDGIPVVTFNSDIVGTKRRCFVGMDNVQSGRAAAGLMQMLMGGTGKVLVITGYFTSHVNNSRVAGFIEEMKTSGPEMEIVGVQGSFDDAQEVERVVENTMHTIPDLGGILLVSSGQAGIRSAFDALRPERRPRVIIYDQTPRNEKALQEDVADFLIDQNGYVQGYRPLHILADLIQKGMQPEEEMVFTQITIKTKYNL